MEGGNKQVAEMVMQDLKLLKRWDVRLLQSTDSGFCFLSGFPPSFRSPSLDPEEEVEGKDRERIVLPLPVQSSLSFSGFESPLLPFSSSLFDLLFQR